MRMHNSIHDKLQGSNDNATIVDQLRQQPIESIAKGIGLNDSFVYINELFSGNKENYTNSISHIDGLGEKEEAMEYVKTYLATQHNWNLEADSAMNFINLIERRYN